MKIPFIKAINGCDVDTEYHGENGEVKVAGVLSSFRDLIKLQGTIAGTINQSCDICADIYKEEVDHEITLFISDGTYTQDHQLNENLDVIELYDGFIDIDKLIESEIEMEKLDYHKCNSCKNS